ncbi:MAG: RNA 2',3'-cyclic phosphodiesterase [Sedimentisphaerales bacterium]|nr:RNA 2',3'-cyclic phosphodiesterase [Sedimentisphaerales bacterium]
MSIRCFIAIELDEAIQREFSRLQEKWGRSLRDCQSEIKWVRPANIHLTLRFLGDVDDRHLVDVCQAATEAAAAVGPFSIAFGGAGTFPPHGAARVAWIGLTEGLDELGSLYKNLEEQLGLLDYPPEHRGFSPHLTLARIRQAAAGQRVRQVVGAADISDLGGQTVTQVTVFQSDLTPAGPIYSALHHAPLTGPDKIP